MDPRQLLQDLAQYAVQLEAVVNGLSDDMLNGSARKNHILEVIDRSDLWADDSLMLAEHSFYRAGPLDPRPWR